MKKILLTLLTTVLFLTGYSQGKWKAQDIWVTDIATVDFDRGKIVYSINHRYGIPNMMPMKWCGDRYLLSVIDIFPPMYFFKKEKFLNLDCFVEDFSVAESDDFDKIKFIKSATLEMIWSTYFRDLFSEETFLKLQALQEDDNIHVSSRAKQAVGLYRKIHAPDDPCAKEMPANLEGFLHLKTEGGVLSVKVYFVREAQPFKIEIKNTAGETVFEKNVKMPEKDRKGLAVENLQPGVYNISLYHKGIKLESKEFVIN